MGEKEYNEAIFGIKDKYIIKRLKDGKVRFQIDIFRYWIAYHFHTLEDLELKNDYHPYPEEKKPTDWKFLLYAGAIMLLAGILFGGYKFFSTPKLQTGDCVRLKEGITEPCNAGKVKKEKKEYITSRKKCKIIGLKGDEGIVECPPSDSDITFAICLKEWEKVDCK